MISRGQKRNESNHDNDRLKYDIASRLGYGAYSLCDYQQKRLVVKLANECNQLAWTGQLRRFIDCDPESKRKIFEKAKLNLS